jgi:nucleoid DNA-binding protein
MAANTKKPPTKSEIYAKIVDDTGLTRKDVAAVFESLNGQIQKIWAVAAHRVCSPFRAC